MYNRVKYLKNLPLQSVFLIMRVSWLVRVLWPNFQNNPKFRLINLAKSDSRKISKSILDKINTKLRSILNENQWRKPQNVIV